VIQKAGLHIVTDSVIVTCWEFNFSLTAGGELFRFIGLGSLLHILR